MSQDWFIDKIGTSLTRIGPDGRQKTVEIQGWKDANYCFELQSYGFSYVSPIEGLNSNVCIACEG